jgi:hypothetical protein
LDPVLIFEPFIFFHGFLAFETAEKVVEKVQEFAGLDVLFLGFQGLLLGLEELEDL